jgi:hypothetical protein
MPHPSHEDITNRAAATVRQTVARALPEGSPSSQWCRRVRTSRELV